MPDSTTPPPGWYPDPSGSGSKSYWDGERWGQPPKRGKFVLIAVGVVLVLAFGISIFSGGKSDDKSSSATCSTAVPSYRMEVDEEPNRLRVFVDRSLTLTEYNEIVADLQRKYADQDGGYFVTINCSGNSTRDRDNRLANAKFAVGTIGAARTGLDAGAKEVTKRDGVQCPLAPLATANADSVTAEGVLRAIREAGLPATDPRDNSQSMCRSVGCVQLMTTDDFSVYQFPDTASATRWASGDAYYQNGTIVLRFNEGGSNPTDIANIPRYKEILDGLMGGR